MTERRRARREPIGLRVRFRKQGSAVEHVGRTADIGPQGLFVRCNRPLPPGTAVELELSSPSAWDPVRLRGEVRWVSPPGTATPAGFGVELDRLDEGGRAALAQLLGASAYDAEEP
ncbi:MAG: PilZ domain-containing protein [Myxococcales bacterium]|nr:PilZ domain-containing protein [Myxococcales bacterium]